MVKLRENTTAKLESNPGKVHFRRWKAMSIGSRISLVVLILIVMIAVLANILAPHDPYAIFTARQAPDAQFLFGTDDKGRDVLSRMMTSDTHLRDTAATAPMMEPQMSANAVAPRPMMSE